MANKKEILDVIIIGAGPAGTMTAKTILEENNNLKVLILEKRTNIGVPVACGGGISRKGLKDVNIQLPEECIENKIVSLRTYYPNRDVKWKYGQIIMPGFILHRDRFDKYIALLARKAGCKINKNEPMENIEKDGDLWVVKTKKGKYYTKIVVGADGPGSRVAELTKVVSKEAIKQWKDGYVVGLEYEVGGVATDKLNFYFDSELAPEGYIWVFPKSKTSAKIGIVAKGVTNLKGRIETFIQSNFSNPKIIENTTVSGTIPGYGWLEKTYGDGVIIVGDAAGQTNPVFYSGIRNSLMCAKFAGEAISNALLKDDFSEKTMSLYEDLWKGYKIKKGKGFAIADPSVIEIKKIIKERGNDTLEILGNMLDNKELSEIKFFKFKMAIKGILHIRNIKIKDIKTVFKAFYISKEYGW
ncbi:MAG: NAD(P)/FAD-dependent oxidoreductase [DPANN group archaeon]|nr:NAD(P)/FAD-dependent oxidoreductase [DPANN group archaeon]